MVRATMPFVVLAFALPKGVKPSCSMSGFGMDNRVMIPSASFSQPPRHLVFGFMPHSRRLL